MSLINQMLRDLDARQAVHGAGLKLRSEVRPLPPVPASRWPWGVAVLAGATVIAVGAFLFMLPETLAPPAAPASASVNLSGDASVSTPQAADSASAAASTTSAAGGLPVSVASSEQEMAQPVPSTELGASLRIADVLAEPARKQRTEKTQTDKPLPEAKKVDKGDERQDEKQESLTGRKAPEQKGTVAAVSPVAPVVDPRAGKAVSIEKTDATAQPRDRVEAAYRKAIAAVNQGRVNEALDALQEVLRQDSLHVAARQLRVRLLLEAGRTDEAVQALQDGLLALPAQTGWAMSLARLQLERGEVAVAAQTLQHSMPVASANPDYLGFTAHVLQRLGRHREAAELYQTATRIAPGDGRWWLGLGLSMEAEGRNDQAVIAFQRAYQAGNLSRELMTLVEQKLRQ